MEPGLEWKDVARDKFASADVASLDGILYRQHNRAGTRTTIKTAVRGRVEPIYSRLAGIRATHGTARSLFDYDKVVWQSTSLLLLEAVLRSSRRDFLKQAAALACACCVPVEGSAQAKSQGPHLEFPARPRDRLAVTSYPFRAYFESVPSHGHAPSVPGVPGMDIKEFPAMVAERFAVYNVNPLLSHFRSTDSAYLESFREAVAKARSHIVDLGLPGRCFATTDTSIAAAAVRDGCQWIDIAAAIGSPSVRQHLSSQPGRAPDLDAAVSNLARLADYGGKRNVVVNLENDNATWEDPFFIVNAVEKVNHVWLRGLPDFGNSIAKYGEEGNEKAVAAMLKHAFNMCHVKEAVELDGKPYHVDLGRMFEIARQSSYRGYFSMEFDTHGGDPIAGTTKLIDETLHYLA
jgi:sugar phosphate isomerase/epimerase